LEKRCSKRSAFTGVTDIARIGASMVRMGFSPQARRRIARVSAF
jgi:hypothetical protein